MQTQFIRQEALPKRETITAGARKNIICGAIGVVLALGLSAAEPAAPKFHQHDNKAAVNLSAQIDAELKALKLPKESDIELLSKLGKDFDSQPVSKTLVETERGGNKVSLAIHERGTGTNESLVIFIH